MAGDDHLEDAHTRAPLAFPHLRAWLQSLQHIKRLGSIVELAHLITNKHTHVFDCIRKVQYVEVVA